MRTRIISAFPGTGKTAFFKKFPMITLDSDSSLFSWVTIDGTKVRNPHFPENYINHIKDNIGKYEFILVSSHKEVRDALINECLYFYLVYPVSSRKEEFLERYKQRGSPPSFITLVENNWDSWIRECESCVGCEQLRMTAPFLSNQIDYIIRWEDEKTTDS